ncbi:MAG: hypothetical protein Q9197_007006 [Variospora fuerteventurae]
MHYQQLPSFLRLLLLSTLILPSFAVEDIDGEFTDRYIDPPTVTQDLIILNYRTAPNHSPRELNVPYNSLYQPPNVQASIISVSRKSFLYGENDVGASIKLGPQEIYCQCFADKAGQQALAEPFTFSPFMPIGSGPTLIGSVFCSDRRGLQKYLAAHRRSKVKQAADEIVEDLSKREGLDKEQGGTPKKARRFSA